MAEKVLNVKRDLDFDRKRQAQQFRSEMTQRGTLVVNLVSSPGAGKTSLLEATAKHWGDNWKMAVLVGDLATDRDAQRLAHWMPVKQLTTGGACHLELALVKRGLKELPNVDFDFLFIENIGNLVCPASHDLGEHSRVVLLSTTEGDDKPGKYPKMFRTSQLMLISKSDLIPHVPFHIDHALEDARLIQPDIDLVVTSALDGSGIDQWCDWLLRERRRNLGA